METKHERKNRFLLNECHVYGKDIFASSLRNSGMHSITYCKNISLVSWYFSFSVWNIIALVFWLLNLPLDKSQCDISTFYPSSWDNVTDIIVMIRVLGCMVSWDSQLIKTANDEYVSSRNNMMYHLNTTSLSLFSTP